jgi:hypothetical protein
VITKLIEEKYNTFFYKTNKYLVGSASSAIYIYLKHKQLDNQNILLPSNICHSIPFSIIYSGNKPLFYDVDSLTGNPSLDSIKKILNKNSVAAIIIPNMYGNIFIDRGSLIEFIEDKEIYIIDDCAASLGADMKYLVKSGDAAIFSFGENKHLDLGVGGLLATDENIDIGNITKNIINNYTDSQHKVQLFDNIFKSVFYSEYYYQLMPQLNNIIDFFKDSYVFKYVWNEELIEELDNKLYFLNEAKRISLEKVEYLNQKINFKNSLYSKYEFFTGSNPWRYNILVNDSSLKEKIIILSLEENILISKWYPPIEPLFTSSSSHKNSKFFSERILNFNHVKTSWKHLDKIINILNKIGVENQK